MVNEIVLNVGECITFAVIVYYLVLKVIKKKKKSLCSSGLDFLIRKMN